MSDDTLRAVFGAAFTAEPFGWWDTNPSPAVYFDVREEIPASWLEVLEAVDPESLMTWERYDEIMSQPSVMAMARAHLGSWAWTKAKGFHGPRL